MPRASRLYDALGQDYATRGGRERGTLRTVLVDGLVQFTGDPRAVMRWTIDRFCDDIFLRYPAKLVGWPPRVPFTNLSKLPMPTSTVNVLLRRWEKGILRWEMPTAGEISAAREDARNAAPGPLFPEQTARHGRNDFGRQRDRPTVDSAKYPPRHVRNGPKSSRGIDDTDEEIEDSPEDGVRTAEGGGVCDRSRLESFSDVDEIEDADTVWGTRERRLVSGELAEDPIEYFSD
ncbi:hypothetical protein GY45DRAFT_1439548 [Cubamyces sp. BRFM 1775]|nr:hypothetical protein GY45DRAFT_1439548 [Cubamyces sp. BRFM 1775]